MGRFDKFKIDLRGLKQSALRVEYDLDNKFFDDIDGQEFQKGAVKAVVEVQCKRDVFDLTITTTGTVVVQCDRCLDELPIEVSATNDIRVKLGEAYADEGDVVVIPENEGEINLAWHLYEFIALALPTKRVHAPGKCNTEMSDSLQKYTRRDSDDDEYADSRETDPRWDCLKNIKIEEDN